MKAAQESWNWQIVGFPEEFSEIGNRHGSMTDLIESCMNKVDITISAEICSKHDLMADSVEISDKDIRTTVHMQAGAKLTY